MLNRNEQNLFRMITGAFASRSLALAVKRDLFTWLSTRGDATLEDIRCRLEFQHRPCRIFIDVLCAAGLVKKSRGTYRNTTLSEQLLLRHQVTDQRANIELFDALYSACDNLESVLETGAPSNRDYGYFFGDSNGQYRELMDQSGVIPGMLLAEFSDFSQSKHVLDVGGCLGRTGIALVTQHPNLSVTVFDLPEVCAKGVDTVAAYPLLNGRICFHAGDFFTDEFPDGADTVTMVRVLHDWPDQQALLLLQKAYRALPRGGRLSILEVVRTGGGAASEAAYVDLLLLLISPGGALRSRSEITSIVRKAGFRDVQIQKTAYLYSLITAEK